MLDLMEDPKSVVRRGYDLVSRTYRADDADDGIYAEWLDVLEKRVEPGSPILDLGCGCGVPVARRLAKRYAVTGWWSHADAETYRRWLADIGLRVEREAFIPEGTGGHTFVLATR